MSERDRARKARTIRMRPDLEETEAQRTLREGTQNVQPADQRWGPPAKQEGDTNLHLPPERRDRA
jgi:hypothetical protein